MSITSCPEQIRNFIINAMKCENCGQVFDSFSDPHTDSDCPKNYAIWDSANQSEIAMEVYKILLQENTR